MSEDLERVAEAYRAPAEDDDDDAAPRVDGQHELFVVSVPKLIILDVITLRLYSVYWFYKHWEQLRRAHGLRVSPLLRGIFSIFFVHKLFGHIDRAAVDEGGVPAAWNASTQATLFVVLSLSAGLLGRVGGVGSGFVISSAVALSTVLPLASAQKQANLASGDPDGESNSRFDGGSIIAVILGSLAWAGYLYMFVIANRVYIPPDP
jgi:hypothetical protein